MTRGGDLDDEFDRVLIGGQEERTIRIERYSTDWPRQFERERKRIEDALGPLARRIEHVGSTAVAGLAAKPVIDIMVTVDDPDDDAAFVEPMEKAGYRLRVRERSHRMFRTPGRDVHIHVWATDSDDERRHLLFRDWLRAHPADRLEHERAKVALAGEWPDMNYYARAKGPVIDRILEHTQSGVGIPSSSPGPDGATIKPLPLGYALDASAWEEWQLEYRYGALYIFPPAGIAEAVDELRRSYDRRSHEICSAHVSLSEPFPRPLTETDVDELNAVLAAIDPFVIRYGPVVSFRPHPGVAYAIQPENRFRKLRDAIHATALFSGSERRRDGVPPHMTIAEFISLERSEELRDQLAGRVPEGEFRCDRIEYAVPDHTFRFRRILSIPIGRGGSAR